MLITEHTEDDSSLPMDVIDFGEYGSQTLTPSGDISFSLDADTEFSQDDFLQQLSNDLEIPLLLDDGTCDRDLLEGNDNSSGQSLASANHNIGTGVLDDIDLSKWDPPVYPSLETIQPGIEYVIKDEIKTEPPSPPSSISSLSSLSDMGNSADGSEAKVNFKVILESPPLSPPTDGASSPLAASIPSCTIVGTSVGTLLPTTIISAAQPVIVPQPIVPRAPKGVKVIRPKPSCSPVQVTATPMETEGPESKASPQAILLSAKEFEALTSQIKKSRTNGNRAPVTLVTHVSSPPVLEKPPPVVTPATPTIAACQLGTSRADLEQIKAMKRQQRMIKNRESACLSRKKKKEYVSTLEEQLTSLKIENDHLRAENQALRDHLVELGVSISPVPAESMNSWLSSSPPLSPNPKTNNFTASTHILSSNGKKITAFFAVLFIVSLNIGPFGGLLNSDQMVNPLRSGRGNVPLSPINVGSSRSAPGAAIVPSSYSSGRTLLWSLGRGHPSIPPIDSEEEDEDVSGPEFNNGNSSIPQLTCPLPINVTESIRLDSELRGWFGVEAWMGANISASEKSASYLKENKPRSWGIPTYPSPLPSQKKPPRVSPDVRGPPAPLPTVAALVNHRLKKKGSKLHQWPLGSDSSFVQGREVAVYGPSGGEGGHRGTKYEYSALLEAIGRREDRFYVVSFSGDNLLLPASAPLLNSSHQPPRPKMTLLLPAVMPNGTVGSADHVTMMQIDCEVTDTQLMTVREGAIPLHLRSKSSSSSSRGNTAPCQNGTSTKGLRKPRAGLHPYLSQVGVAGKGRL
ncbi:cyclic AMP-dependent transcription factor ATF-6 alpha [Ischnura elegans]|uniref:cyclic AMP-dependent transcription factor ATF-6 alpha n=1 Tax=Ischnura elegans TaxID=197161 RepID=UPI001ED8B75D|nr:cyclic AMP-dependent transcription factor ATF-6 alpha [Ischnura elegans]